MRTRLLLAAFLAALPGFSAGVVTQTLTKLTVPTVLGDGTGRDAWVLHVQCIADAANGTCPATVMLRSADDGTLADTNGLYLYSLITDPGTPAPTDNYDITAVSSQNLDILGGAGADRDTANTEQAAPGTLNSMFNGNVTFTVANNSVNSAVIVADFYLLRQGALRAGGSSATLPLSVANGGTGATSFTASRCIESNGAGTALVVAAAACSSGSGNVTAAGTLTSNQIVLGAGTTAVATLGSLGTTTTLLHGNAAGAPTFGAIVNADITNSTIDLTAKVTGTLPFGNGGTGATSLTASRCVEVNGGGTALTVAAAACGVGTVLGGANLTTTGAVPFQSGTTATLTQDAGFLWDSTNHRMTAGTGTDLAKIGYSGSAGYSCVWFNTASPSVSNCSLQGNGSATIVNAPSGGDVVYIQVGNSNVAAFTSGIANIVVPTKAIAFIGGGSIPSVGTCGTIGTGSTNAAGFITSGTTGACTPVLTFNGYTATTGWSCAINNSTTVANIIQQSGSSTTTATFSGTTISGDVLRYACTAY